MRNLDLEKPINCCECSHYSIHPSYPYLVICLMKDQLISQPREGCEDYVEKNWKKLVEVLSEKGFLYCVECNKPIYTIEELTKHKKEFIPIEFFHDDVASEEALAAD